MKLTGITVAAGCLALGLAAPPLAMEASKDAETGVTVQTGPDRKVIWMKSRAKNWDTEHRTWVQRGGYTGFRIPDDKFTLHFGPEHTFRINTLPYREIRGNPYYVYQGYSMRVVDPWPESWPEGWYDTDDVYVKWDDGYYLYNRKYPEIGLALEFSE
jgi:hypothetical protein